MSDLNPLQYPIGQYTPPPTFSPAERAANIAVLAAFPAQLAAALGGLTDEQYDTPYRPEGWTIRQLTHHVGDSHLNAYSRMRLAITTEWPVIYAYPQKLWAELADTKLSPLVSAQLLDAVHQRWVWRRCGRCRRRTGRAGGLCILRTADSRLRSRLDCMRGTRGITWHIL